MEKKNKEMCINFSLSSEIKNEETDSYVASRLQVSPDEDITNAQVIENRSGVKKLYNIALTDSNFNIVNIGCQDRYANVHFSYRFELQI